MFIPSFSCLFNIGFELCLFSFKPSSVPFYLSCLLSDSPLTFSGLFWNIIFRGINIDCICRCFLETRYRYFCNWNSYLSLSAFYQIFYPFFYLNLFSNIIMKLACQYQMIHLFWDLRQCIKTITLVLSHIYNYKILNIFASNSKDKIKCVWCILLLYHDRYFFGSM